MKKYIKLILSVIVIISFVVFCLIYTRPRTLEQRYPYLDFTQCSEIKGYFFTASDAEGKQFAIKSTDAGFRELVGMIQTAQLKTRLGNLLPQGTKTHTYSGGDYKWDVILYFDHVALPDGSTGSGDFLDINNFFGNLSFSIDGETVFCSTDTQEQWTKDIMDIISQHTVE